MLPGHVRMHNSATLTDSTEETLNAQPVPVTPGAIVGHIQVVPPCCWFEGRGTVCPDPMSVIAFPPLEIPCQACAVDLGSCTISDIR